jgi:hypothetical protein
MPVSRKSTVPVSTKQSPGKAAAPAARPFLRFYHSQELRVRTLAVLLAVEGADEATAYSGDLSELILELTNSGLDQYFLQPLKATKVSFVVQQSAALGMSGVHKVMGTVIRNVLGRMDDRQLLSVCGSIRKLMT